MGWGQVSRMLKAVLLGPAMMFGILGVEGGESVEDALADDAFAAAFDEELGGGEKTEPEAKTESEAKTEPEAKAEPEPKAEPTPEPKLPTAAELAAEIAAKLKPEPEAKTDPAPEPEPEDSDEVKQALADMKENWPAISLGVETLISKAVKQTREAMMEEFRKYVDPIKAQIEPVVQTVTADSAAKAKQTILAAHADAFDLAPEMEKWVEKQPKFMQPAYNAILDGQGTVQDAIDFITAFKKATGRDKPAEPEKKEDPAKASRLARMEVPGSVRTSVTAEPEPDDFDSAFEAEIKKFKAAN